MERFFEFIGNHAGLAGTLVVLVIMLIITESRRAGKALTAQSVINLINNHEAVIVDVRDESEYNSGHIVNSVNIPYTLFKDRYTELNKHKESPVIVVCSIGQHSGACGRMLGSAGFTQVNRLQGGVSGWRAEGLPLVKS